MTQPEQAKDLISILSILHKKLYDVLGVINFCLSLPSLICCAQYFTYNIVTIFSSYTVVTADILDKGDFVDSLFNIVWNFIYLHHFLTLVYFGNRMSFQVSRTILLSKILYLLHYKCYFPPSPIF